MSGKSFDAIVIGGGNIYRGSYTATICPRANRPKALVVTELMPPPHKPLLPKAQLLQMKPAVPAEFVAEFAFEPSWARDGRISWYLKHKVSHQTVLTMTIEDKRNELYTRRERSKRLFGKYPMVRYDNGWMWTYVGNFNIDVSTTGYNDPRVKSNAVLEKVFKSLPLSQFEKL